MKRALLVQETYRKPYAQYDKASIIRKVSAMI